MPTRQPITWILVANGARAQLFVHERLGGDLVQRKSFTHDESRQKTLELISDRPGRDKPGRPAGLGGQHQGFEPRHDPHRQEKQVFARELARQLDAAATKGTFDRLVLVAPPSTLGDLRAALGSAAQSRVTAELAKDLTQAPKADLATLLETVMAL